jgi:hypothetical protein
MRSVRAIWRTPQPRLFSSRIAVRVAWSSILELLLAAMLKLGEVQLSLAERAPGLLLVGRQQRHAAAQA